MKPIYITMIALMASSFAFSQTSFPARKNFSFTSAIESVLHDFPNNLWNICGEHIVSQGEVDQYSSRVILPGAEECLVTRYHSLEDSTASWQAIMYREENFHKASARYKELYSQLKSCHLKLVGGGLIYMNGQWQAPDETNDFTVSSLRLETGDDRYKEVKMDLEMLYQFPEWIININIVSKKKDSLEGYAGSDGN